MGIFGKNTNSHWWGFLEQTIQKVNGTYPITLSHTPCLLCSQDLRYTTNWQWTVRLIESRGKAKTVVKYIPLTLYPLRGSRGISNIPSRHPRFTKVYPVTGGKPIADLLQCISGLSAINPFVAFYDMHGRKREVLFYFVPYTTRDCRQTHIEFNQKKIKGVLNLYIDWEG
jgi:hypothetical protein